MSFHANTILTGTHFLRMVTCDQVSFFVYLFLGWAIVSAIVFCGNIYFFCDSHIRRYSAYWELMSAVSLNCNLVIKIHIL